MSRSYLKPRARCLICGKEVRLLQSGLLAIHKIEGSLCYGSKHAGRPLLRVSEVRRAAARGCQLWKNLLKST